MQNTFPLTSREFPAFDLSTMPALPEGFEESSWHNDVAPSYVRDVVGGLSVHIWIHEADPAEREQPDFPRFAAYLLDYASGQVEGSLYESDTWADVERHALLLVAANTEKLSELYGDWLALNCLPDAIPVEDLWWALMEANRSQTSVNSGYGMVTAKQATDEAKAYLERFEVIWDRVQAAGQ